MRQTFAAQRDNGALRHRCRRQRTLGGTPRRLAAAHRDRGCRPQRPLGHTARRRLAASDRDRRCRCQSLFRMKWHGRSTGNWRSRLQRRFPA